MESGEKEKLHEGVEFRESRLDRRLLYEVSGFKFDSDEEDYDSNDTSS